MAYGPSTIRSSARWIPFVFLVGMLAVLAANAALIYFAFDSWTGIATPRAFERGLGYNRVLAAAEREDELGWRADLRLGRSGDGIGGSLVVQLSDREGRPVEAILVAELSRPLEATPALSVALSPVGGGEARATLGSMPRSGQWDIRITASRGPDTVHINRRVFVP